MALQAAYKQFLAAPSSSALANDASLHYVTTTSSFTGATDIIKHLSTVRNTIKKKKEDALFAIENHHALAVEVDTTLEFVSSGGPYLPGMDENFLSDRTVHLSITHIVMFNADGKISQIRQSWDQGSLLKQIEVLGRTGANWPIRDAKAQISLIAKCVKDEPSVPAASALAESRPSRARGDSTNAMRDPHASLDLFAPRERQIAPEAVISPYAGARPRQRSFTEILGDESEDPGSPSNGRERSRSPTKGIAHKAGAGKNFQPIRLFHAEENNNDHDDDEPLRQPAQRFVRPSPKKYQHFDFDDGSETQDVATPKAPVEHRKSKHDSTWSFEDFVTPQKVVPTRGVHRARNSHWNDDNEVLENTLKKPTALGAVHRARTSHWNADNEVLENTPAHKQAVAKPRRDAEVHFDVADAPVSDRPRGAARPPAGTASNSGSHLYDERLHTAEGTAPSPGPALGNITNLKNRGKDFDPHFNFTDESPHHANGGEPAKVAEDRKKAVRMMESNWSVYDTSPVSRKENDNPNAAKRAGDERGIVIAGDGMGGKKGTSRSWMTGEDDDEPLPLPTNKKGGRGPPTKSEDSFWDF
ncbi:hypothetical protein N0V88_004059 [Collariella sp. IMI 366227]|nr:hypothetical protein N0V88_004059 [Collariella sp. IMI 366227]